MRSNYSYEIIGDVIKIEDLGGNFMSVTNNIEGVVREIADKELSLEFFNVIYRDSEGVWDGWDERVGFISLNAKSFEEAVPANIHYWLTR